MILLSACNRFQQQPTAEDVGVTIEMMMEPVEPQLGPARLVFTLTDSQGRPIDNASLDIEGNMTHAGMIPVFAQSDQGQTGRYIVPFEWTMGGDWIVTVEVSLADGQKFSHQVPVFVQ